MSTTIKLRRSAVPGRIPTVGQLDLGELAINTADGKIYFKKYDPVANTESVIDVSANLDPDAILELLKGVDGANSGLDADLLDGQSGDYYLDYNNFTNVPPATLDLTLSGKVTGNAFSNTGIMTLITELANTGVTPGTYGSASLVPVITIDEDGRITVANTVSVAGVSNTYWTSSNNTFTIETADGGIYNNVIEEFTDITVNDLTANNIIVNGLVTDDLTANNIIVNGLVDGRDIAADGAKLDTLEDGLDLTLTGKVTGFASSNTGVMSIVTELANTGVTPGTYGSSTAVPVITIDEDGRITVANTTPVSGVEDFVYAAANNTITLETGDGSLFNVKTQTTVELTGKVTGTATSSSGTVTIAAELANTGVTPGTYGSSTSIPVITVDEDGRVTLANTAPVSGVEDFYFVDANNTITLETSDGTVYLAHIDKLDRIEEDLTVTLQGKVTGTVTSNTGIMTVQTELANTGVTPGTYGSPTSIPIITVDEDGRITLANTASVSGVEDFYWTSSNNTLILETGDGTEYKALIQEFNSITANTVNGRNITTDGAKLDGIEAGATADQTAADIRALGFFDTTNDGVGSGLDADLLDGQHASDIIAAAVSQSGAQIGNGKIDIISGVGLIGSGTFRLNDFSNTAITISHSDTSSVANTALTLGNVVTGITFDTFGHAQTVTSTNLDNRYYTETELNAGQLNNLYYTETELNNGQLDNRYYTETELNAGQLNNLYYTKAQLYTKIELDAGQLDNRYYTETELNNGQLDNRYYTETEADTRFVNVTGDTMSGELTVNADIIQSESRFISKTQTTASTAQVAIHAFPYATFGAAEVLITVTETGKRHITKLLITHNSATAIATEFGVVYTNTELASFDVAITGPVLQILATPASSISTTFKIVATLIDA